MSITSQDMLHLLYDRKLPQLYRTEDEKIGYPLKRYLESLICGGFCGSIEDIENVMSFIDPSTIPEEYLPYLCESFGLPYFPNIDSYYQRKFLSNIGEIIRRRGTYSCIHYLIRVLTELDVELTYFEGVHDGVDGNYLFIELLPKSIEQLEEIETSMLVIKDYIAAQVPYYVTPVITSQMGIQVIRSTKSYSHSAIGTSKFYYISSREDR